MSLTHGSIFTGIGGFDRGFDLAGVRTRWQIEKDAFCREILAKHWPKVRRYEDVERVDPKALAAVDVVSAGFPCQDLSVANSRGKGLDGPRSGLWREVVRILEGLDSRPRFVVVENVLRGWRRWVPAVRHDLQRLGYASLPLSLRASDFGAPHARGRCIIVADALAHLVRVERWRRSGSEWQEAAVARLAREGRIIADAHGAKRPRALAAEGGASIVADSDRARELSKKRPRQVGRWPSDCAQWSVEPDVARVVHGLSAGVDRRREKKLGNAVIPQIAGMIALHIVDCVNGR